MPAYVVKCGVMDHYEEEMTITFEEYQKIINEGKCPVCGAYLTRKWQGNTLGIQLKGSGFHNTDYGSE